MVTATHFMVDFLYQNNKSAFLKIATRLGFQDREPVFNELTTPYFSSSDSQTVF
jgi:hypothetical protein